MNIEQDRWLYVYAHSAQRAREFFGLPPNAEVRLSQEQIEGALSCWAVKVPPPQPKKEPHWSDKGEIRLECRLCDTQYDMIAAIPPGWTDVEEIRSFKQAIEPVPMVTMGRNKYGDTVWDWQTHFGVCPECREECKEEAAEAPKLPTLYCPPGIGKLGSPPEVKRVDCPPNRVELSNRELAVAAKGHLFHSGGFTLDEFGNPATGDIWAVSVAGKECVIPGKPCIREIKAYLDRNPLGAAFFGGWYNKAENVTYLDHTLLYTYKHTAVAEGLKNKQKAIYNLQTQETLDLAEFS